MYLCFGGLTSKRVKRHPLTSTSQSIAEAYHTIENENWHLDVKSWNVSDINGYTKQAVS